MNINPDLSGRTAVVTGSTSGIGLGIATALAEQGANVVLNGFGDQAEIEQIRARLERMSPAPVVYDGTDMSKPEEITAMVARIQKRFGSLDVVVNNAGIQTVEPVESFPPER